MAGQPVMTEAVKARGDVEVLAVSPGIASRSTTATRQSFPAADQNPRHRSPEKLRFARRRYRPVILPTGCKRLCGVFLGLVAVPPGRGIG
jgi:hypothetical protein